MAFNPYEAWLGIACGEQRPDYYRLLGLRQFEADQTLIKRAAEHQLARIERGADGQHAAVATALREQIIAARNVLLSPPAKQTYDRALQGKAASTPAQPAGAARQSASPATPPPQSAPTREPSAARPRRPIWRQPRVVFFGFMSGVITSAIMVAVALLMRPAERLDRGLRTTVADGTAAPRPVTIETISTKPAEAVEVQTPAVTSSPPNPLSARARELRTPDTPPNAKPAPLPISAPAAGEGAMAASEKKTAARVSKPRDELPAEPREVTLGDGTVVKLDRYGKTYQGYDWRPPITVYSPELNTLLDSKVQHKFSFAASLNFDLAHDKMYWTSWITDKRLGRIQRANLDGSGIEDLVTGLEEPRTLACDFARGKMFWTEITHFQPENCVQSADLDGHNVQTILAGAVTPVGIAVDPRTGAVFYHEAPRQLDQIHCVRPDGSGETTILGRSRPGLLDGNSLRSGETEIIHTAGEWNGGCRSMMVNPADDKLYWIAGDRRVWQANLDGSQAAILADFATRKLHFAFDPQDQKFYWGDTGSLYRSNRDGTQAELLVVRTAERQDREDRAIGAIGLVAERRWIYFDYMYFIGIAPYNRLVRFEIPPLLKPVTKPAPPRIASLRPLKQSAGGKVVVSGTGFNGVTKVALFDDAAGGETPIEFKEVSDTQLSFDMPKLSEKCRHTAVIIVTAGGATVTLPTSLSIGRPTFFNSLPHARHMNTATHKGKYENFWYVVGQHEKLALVSETETRIGGLNYSLAYVEPQAEASSGPRGHNALFVKDGAHLPLPNCYRNVIYHEPFAIIGYGPRPLKTPEEMETTLIPVPAIRPSFLAELLEYEQPQ